MGIDMNNVFEHALQQFGGISVTGFLVMTLVMILIASGILIGISFGTGKNIGTINMFAILALIIYVNIILQMTILGRSSGSRIGIDLSIHRSQWSGGTDFSRLIRLYSVLNVLLFVPFGFLVSLFTVISGNRAWLQCVVVSLLSLVSSLLIECVQLVTGRGYFELDDLLCNTLGGFIGCLLAVILRKLYHTLCSKEN